ncbi:hypothetical protein [Arthrobacter oryzae]|uniref:hypothetical protein n=1 Tax=Arthrobacter oryzae TaxID=409290 RepID=UPI0028641877|nr:hypothetical protein [Arthrobacter oryzae]MDR6505265.1 hypothetical protein [Arthrobacter oryzae]
MDAITPLQSPRLIIAVGVFLVFLAGIMAYGAFAAAAESEPGLSAYAAVMAGLALVAAWWAFVMARRRRHWLRGKGRA